MITIEIMNDYRDGRPIMERKTFKNKKDMYKYIIVDMLETAREDLNADVFTGLCLNICGFMAEYFT